MSAPPSLERVAMALPVGLQCGSDGALTDEQIALAEMRENMNATLSASLGEIAAPGFLASMSAVRGNIAHS